MARYCQVFSVSGCDEFPFDMLRYDECWPANGENSVLLGDQAERSVQPSGTLATRW